MLNIYFAFDPDHEGIFLRTSNRKLDYYYFDNFVTFEMLKSYNFHIQESEFNKQKLYTLYGLKFIKVPLSESTQPSDEEIHKAYNFILKEVEDYHTLKEII